MNDTRRDHLVKFYNAMDTLERILGGKRNLSDCDGRMDWPKKGIYFFFEPGEQRTDTGHGPRLVRIGTHALTQTSKTKLWNRLSQHRGTQKSGGGNHRGSIFRLLLGTSMLARDQHVHLSWGNGNSAPRDIRDAELHMEKQVSVKIGAMPFLWLDVDSPENGPELRGTIERNSIALLSNYDKPELDSPSQNWLGLHCDRERVVNSGLWNNNHVNEDYDPSFLSILESQIDEMSSQS